MRFSAFTAEERAAIADGLMGEADLDPTEDPAFPKRVEVANGLLDELEQVEREQ